MTRMTNLRRTRIAWFAACGFAAAAPVPLACSAGPWVTVAVFGLLVGGTQALAITGGRSRRILWAVFTTLGSWAAFPFGLIGGVAALFAVAAILSLLPGGADALRGSQLLLVGAPFGGLVGGTIVGAFQAGLVREPATWIARSALGGIIVLPTALAAMYGSTAGPCADQPTALITAAAIASGVIYAWLTLDGATTRALSKDDGPQSSNELGHKLES